MSKPVKTLLFLAAASCAAILLWDVLFPRLFATSENKAAIASARSVLNEIMPLHGGDQLISETTYNHGGEVGIGRRYASSEPRESTQREFDAQAASSRSVSRVEMGVGDATTFWHGHIQVGIDYPPPDNGYFVYAVKDSTAVRPLNCHHLLTSE